MSVLSERDLDYLASILDHCDRIAEARSRFGDSSEAFLADADYRDVVMMNLFQIGEAANLLSDECKETINQVPWHQIYGMRNRIAHAYIKVEDAIVWQTAKEDVPLLKEWILQYAGELA